MELAHQEAVKTLKMVCCPCMDLCLYAHYTPLCVCIRGTIN